MLGNAIPDAFKLIMQEASSEICRLEWNWVASKRSSRLNATANRVNDHTEFRLDWMPFAGLCKSGLGMWGISYSMRDTQIDKMMVISSKRLG